MDLRGHLLLAILLCLLPYHLLAGDRGVELKVGIYENPPLVSGSTEAQPEGLFIEIIQSVAMAEGWQLTFIPGTWQENIQRIELGEIDLLPAIAITDQRRKKYRFIEQHVISNWGQLYVAEESPISTIPDLDGRVISVLKDDVYVKGSEGIPALCKKFSLNCRFIEMGSYAEVMRAVEEGTADAGLVNRLYGSTRGDRFKVKSSAIIIMPLDIRFALNTKNPALASVSAAIDRNLIDLKKDKESVYYRALNSIVAPPRIIEKIPAWTKWTLAIALLVLSTLLIGNNLLRWQVKTRTRELTASELRYRELFENASISIWEEDFSWIYREFNALRRQGIESLEHYLETHPGELERFLNLLKIVDVNQAALNMLNANSREELLVGLPRIFSPSSLEVFKQGLLSIWSRQPKFTSTAEHLTLDGRKIEVLISHPIADSIEKSVRIPVIILDITEQKLTAQTLLEREAQLHTLIDSLPDLVWLKDTSGTYLKCNQKFEQFFGAKEQQIIGKTDFDFVSNELANAFRRHDKAAIQAGKPTINEEMITYAEDGHEEVLETIKTPVYASDGQLIGVLGVGRDITLRKEQEERILHQAHFDALTDLPNRFLSLDRLSQLLSDAQRNSNRVGVLFLDLDDFKRINDTLGHDTGDKLLIEVAERLQQTVRKGDTVGRLGGDEFIILLGSLQRVTDVKPVIEVLLARLRQAFTIDNRELMITSSIGIAIFPDDGETPTELLRNADSAMYHSKSLGRNTHSYFMDAMNQEVTRRFALEEQMHGALERKEFYILFQPQVDIRSQKIVGIEALLRWTNPALGAVTPGEFIPIAEHTGLIVPIGRFVTEEALKQFARLQDRLESDLRVAINLSPRQFRDPHLVRDIRNALKKCGLTGQSLDLEITEGVLLDGQGHIEETLNELNQLGIRLSMDDFGTGYSSLSYLRSYPFDTIKIDRTFLKSICSISHDRELISAIVAMAHGLGMRVVAEGVETESQLKCLHKVDCDLAQGYLFSKPVEADLVYQLLLESNAHIPMAIDQ